MDWLDALRTLRSERTPAVIVTLVMVRGHAPRNGGAKMVVSPAGIWGTVGGGNLEATAVSRARAMLAAGTAEPELLPLRLNDKAVTEYGVQCCGGEVTMLLEPVRVVPSVAVFGIGHVGIELARILSRHEIDLFLVDSRAEMLHEQRLGAAGLLPVDPLSAGPLSAGPLSSPVARVHVRRAPVPESVLTELPTGSHVLVMTHDHVEDLAIVDQSLRTPGVGSIGLIGSSAKWSRFRTKLLEAGHSESDLERVTTPIGIAEVTGKQPAVIAVSVAARILVQIEQAAPAS